MPSRSLCASGNNYFGLFTNFLIQSWVNIGHTALCGTSSFSYQGKIQLKYGFKRGYKSNFDLNGTDIAKS